MTSTITSMRDFFLVAAALATIHGSAFAQAVTPALKKSALAELAKSLKDPESARISNLFVTRAKDGTKVLCGKVTARNSFGGYADPVWFFYMDDKNDPMAVMQGESLDMLIKTFCADTPAIRK